MSDDIQGPIDDAGATDDTGRKRLPDDDPVDRMAADDPDVDPDEVERAWDADDPTEGEAPSG